MAYERAGNADLADEPDLARIAGASAILAGGAGLVYSISFVVLKTPTLSALMLAAGGILSGIALVGLYRLLLPAGRGLALIELGLGVVGVVGAAVHGAYDLANALHPAQTSTDLPNAVDPRGFLTFGVSGLGVLWLSVLAMRSRRLPAPWAYLGVALGVLLIVVYLGRLIVLDASSPLILAPAALVGFVLNPIWYVWLGRGLIARGAAS